MGMPLGIPPGGQIHRGKGFSPDASECFHKQRVWRRSDRAPDLAAGTATFPRETASRLAWWYGLGLLCGARAGLLGLLLRRFSGRELSVKRSFILVLLSF